MFGVTDSHNPTKCFIISIAFKEDLDKANRIEELKFAYLGIANSGKAG